MKKDIFAENISVETTAKLLDEMFAYEKAVKRTSIKANLTKIIPAVASILIIIGLVSIVPMIDFDGLGGFGTANSPSHGTNGVSSNHPTEYLTVIPRVVEASIFDSLIANFPEGRPRQMMNAYYSRKDLTSILGIEHGIFYVFDPNASEVEIEQILGFWNEYAGWSDAEYFAMVERYGLAIYRKAMINNWSIQHLTEIPRIIEASIFDSLMANFPEGRSRNQMLAYYSRKDLAEIANMESLTLEERERIQAELLERFPFVEHGAFYIFDPNATEREIQHILRYWNEYTNWSDAEYFAMVERYGLALYINEMAEAAAFRASPEGRDQQLQERRDWTAEYIIAADYWWAENYPWILEHAIIHADTRNLQIFDILINQHGRLPDGISPFGVSINYRDTALANHIANCDICGDCEESGFPLARCEEHLLIYGSIEMTYEAYAAWIAAEMEWWRTMFFSIGEEWTDFHEEWMQNHATINANRKYTLRDGNYNWFIAGGGGGYITADR